MTSLRVVIPRAISRPSRVGNRAQAWSSSALSIYRRFGGKIKVKEARKQRKKHGIEAQLLS